MTVRLRFAPSPTGFLHIGNARTALLNALVARREGGAFVLRLDDTDLARSEERFATAIVEDLEWLGIPPDEVARQSERFDLYREAVERLKAAGLLYPCYETAEELDTKRKRRRSTTAPACASTTRRASAWKMKDASRTGGSCCPISTGIRRGSARPT